MIRTLLSGALLAICLGHASGAAANPCYDPGSCTSFGMKNPANGLYDGHYACLKPGFGPHPGGNPGGPPPPPKYVNHVDPAENPQTVPDYPAGTPGKWRASLFKCGGVNVLTPGPKGGTWAPIMVANPWYIDPTTGMPDPTEPATIPKPCGFYRTGDVCAIY